MGFVKFGTFCVVFLCHFFISWAQPSGIGWYLVLEDTFSGSRINEKLWMKNFPWGQGKDAIAPNVSNGSHHILKDGILHLMANNDTILDEVYQWTPDGIFQPYKKRFPFSTSLIYSRQAFQFGYFEMRCRMPAFNNPLSAQGIGPSFWLYQEKQPEVKWCEIDIFETYHYNIQTRNIHFQDHQPVFHFQSERDSSYWEILDHGDWHTFSCEWTTDHIFFYIDGKLIQEYWGDWIKNMIPMNLIAGIALPTANIRRELNPEINNYYMEMPGYQTLFPYFFEIDYIRVWQKDVY